MPDQPRRGIDYKDLDKEFFGQMDNNQKPYQPFIYDLVTKEKLFFQTIPQEISEETESQTVAIATPGRNNPHYQYTGSEDTIKMDMSFYADHESRQDVIKKVKWLQALGKNNGYEDSPHLVLLSFGDMYKGSTFTLTEAPVRYGLFNRQYKMLPCLAQVSLTFKRVTKTNRTRAEILRYDT